MLTRAALQFVLFPSRGWRIAAVLLSAGVIAAAAKLDWMTHGQVFAIVYAVPVALVAWIFGAGAGAGFAVGCAALWLGLNRLAGIEYEFAALPYVNGVLRLAVHLLVVWCVARARGTLEWLVELIGRDPLTGVHNRHGFIETAEVEFERARRAGYPLTLAFVDLDGFKLINDRYGHPVGDQVLRDVGMLLRTHTRAGDLVARLGGDEVALLLPATVPDSAAASLDAIRRRVGDFTAAAGWPVTMSVGAVTLLRVGGTVEDALSRADRLLYGVKRSGKNTVQHEVVDALEPTPPSAGPGPVTGMSTTLPRVARETHVTPRT